MTDTNKARAAYDAISTEMAKIDRVAVHDAYEPFPKLFVLAKTLGMNEEHDVDAPDFGALWVTHSQRDGNLIAQLDYRLEPAENGQHCHHGLQLTLTDKGETIAEIEFKDMLGPVMRWEAA